MRVAGGGYGECNYRTGGSSNPLEEAYPDIREYRNLSVVGKTGSRFSKGTRALGVVGMAERAVIPISPPQCVRSPQTHTRTHTQHSYGCDSRFLSWLQQKHGTMW